MLSGFLLFTNPVISQVGDDGAPTLETLSKPEKKKWKKIARNFKKNPDALKLLTEEREYYQDEAEQMRMNINHLKADLDAKDRLIADMQQEIERLGMQVTQSKETLQTLSAENVPEEDWDEGIVFKVQIGAYSQLEVPENVKEAKNMSLETSNDMKKIIVGAFRNYEKANQLKEFMRTMGVKDAWIVSYKDGIRVSIEKAMKEAP